MSNETQSPQMSVLLLGPYPPPHGGVEINVAALRAFFLRRRIPCAVINLTRYRKTEDDGVYYPRSAFGVIRLLLKLEADVIHLHVGGDVTWRLLILGLVCSLMRKSKVLLTLHSGGYPSSPAGRAARPNSLRGFLFRRFDGLIGVNKQIVEMFIRFGVRRDRTQLILPFSFSAEMPETPLPRNMSEFFLAHSPAILTVSGLERAYDLSLQIEELGAFRQEHPQAGLMIIGDGSLENEIRNLIKSKPYGKHILLVGDVAHDTVLQAMAHADIFLRTTLYDGDSIAIREALHLGLPVVVTDNGMRPPGIEVIPASNLSALHSRLLAVAARGLEKNQSSGYLEVHEKNLEEVLSFYEALHSNSRLERLHKIPVLGPTVGVQSSQPKRKFEQE